MSETPHRPPLRLLTFPPAPATASRATPDLDAASETFLEKIEALAGVLGGAYIQTLERIVDGLLKEHPGRWPRPPREKGRA
jgi:hypothetical protein